MTKPPSQDWQIESYNYDLPPELIAQEPADPRESCRLLVYHQKEDRIEHRHFSNIGEYLRPGDLLVLNDTKVIPARIFGKKNTGGRVEIFLLEQKDDQTWDCLIRPGRRLPEDTVIQLDQEIKDPGVDLTAVIGPRQATGSCLVRFPWARNMTKKDFLARLDQIGQVPLPPYIKTAPTPAIRRAYQTVFAANSGAVAAPTAGLHFSRELLQKLESQGVELAYLTLHTGWGTFQPMKSEDIRQHKIHPEVLEISRETADRINQALEAKRRLICVGTTVVRALESAAAEETVKEEPIGAASVGENFQLKPFCGPTELFICPGYQFKIAKNLLTNFHLPRSSLLALVSALIGRKKVLKIYAEAIAQKYRFFSFGDAMIII